MNKIIIIIIVAAIIVLGGSFLLRSVQPSKPNSGVPQGQSQQTSETPRTTQASATPQAPAADQNVVTYTDAGYSPGTIRVKVSTTVMFKNNSSQAMWTASAFHPTHTVYHGTSLSEHCPDTKNVTFDACKGIQPGSSWSFTFDKVGSWNYHNHLNPSDTGTIIVEKLIL